MNIKNFFTYCSMLFLISLYITISGNRAFAADDDESDSSTTVKSSSEKVLGVKAVPIVEYIYVVEKGYDRDGDGDGLVDAIDPDPDIDQRAFFTDSDDDGIPDVYDRYKGDDYVQFEDTDVNNNGVLDSLE